MMQGRFAASLPQADRASRGGPRVVHPSGPAGTGKTALAGIFSGQLLEHRWGQIRVATTPPALVLGSAKSK